MAKTTQLMAVAAVTVVVAVAGGFGKEKVRDDAREVQSSRLLRRLAQSR